MVKKITFTILFLIIAGIVYFFGSMKLNFAPRYYYTLITANSNLNNENINGLKLYQSMKDNWFISKYGKEYKDINNALYNYYQLKDGVVIATNKGDDKIIRIILNSQSDNSLRTNKGTGIGDSIDSVKEVYGEKYYIRHEQGSNIIGYVDKNKTLEFWYLNGKVQEIRYDIRSMD